jgi:putative transposase
MNYFLKQLSKKYPNDNIIVVLDNAYWHKSQYTVIPKKVQLIFIPPYTPEMNPIEQVWREIKTKGFKNRFFKSINEAEQNIHTTISSISKETLQSITQRSWIMDILNLSKPILN